MIKQTFIHIPGIGPATEHQLWSAGFGSWEEYLGRSLECKLPLAMRDRVISYLKESLQAVNGANYHYFEDLLPSSEIWRLYGDLRGKAAFLDIETTGLIAGPNAITMIGLFDGLETRVFIQGIDLDEFISEIQKYSLIVTFNGKRFDVPFIRYVLGNLPEGQAHFDLMYPLRHLGYRGGLKSVETQLGIGRQGILRQVDGLMAVLLWREYKKGNKAALNTLIRYNLEDVVNLQYLANRVYNISLERLPISVKPLPEPQKYCLDDFRYDEELLEYLQRQIQKHWL